MDQPDHPERIKEKIVYQEDDNRQEQEYGGVPGEKIILFLLVPTLFGLGVMIIVLRKINGKKLPPQGSWLTNGTLAKLSRMLCHRKPHPQTDLTWELENRITGFKEAVQCEMVPAVAIGENVTLSCNFTLPLDILQITWQKRIGPSFQNIATYSKRHRPKSVGLLQNRVLFTDTRLNASSITLPNVTLQDEGDYKCLFNAFPHGSFSRNTHLTVQAVSEIRTKLLVNFISQGILTVICSATGRPAPKITWRPEGVLTDHRPQVGNGTVMVTNVCNFSVGCLKRLTCVMDHPDHPERIKEKIVYQAEDNRQEQKYKDVPEEMMNIFLLVPILSVLVIMIMVQRKRKGKKSQVSSMASTPAREAFLHEDQVRSSQNLQTPRNQDVSYQNEVIISTKKTPEQEYASGCLT
ncbi:OX-2 membrane glycoprotein-like [Alligator mississippiensis]|uniref:OX-2 membrane glycoprotein-like n=1 Tax=Alligator mississippiensis TaxID=8496 RepID=A0A151MD97_ALLMI|nr:OX-2 membrane glycoprotein-like [Alligator mississippiensis]